MVTIYLDCSEGALMSRIRTTWILVNIAGSFISYFAWRPVEPGPRQFASLEERPSSQRAFKTIQAPQIPSPDESSVNKDSRGESDSAWPRTVFGKPLQITIGTVSVYAHERDNAEELVDWMRRDMRRLLVGETDSNSRGIIVAIEARKDDLPPRVREWHARRVDRRRPINWTSKIRNQKFSSNDGRPYTLFTQIYFTEGFVIPNSDIQKIDESLNITHDTWICLLTTESHLAARASDALRVAGQVYESELAEVPIAVRALSALGSAMVMTLRSKMIDRARALDLELMHLQRKETVEAAVIRATCGDIRDCQDQLISLRDKIDTNWKRVWETRPLD